MSVRGFPGVALQVLCWFLPATLGNMLRRHLLGWELAIDARIGFSLLDVDRVVLRPAATIGHFNVFRNLDLLAIDSAAQIGHFNRISGRPDNGPEYLTTTPRRSIFTLGRESAITHRHYFDCTHSISIGQFVTIAGSHSQFWSHGLDVKLSRQTAEPITIGDYCMLGTRLIILKGVTVGDCCVVAAGSVLSRSLDNHVLAGGAPARKIKDLEPDFLYFKRTTGPIN